MDNFEDSGYLSDRERMRRRGAWWQGKGPEYDARNKGLPAERKQAFAQDVLTLDQFSKAGDVPQMIRLLEDRLAAGNRLSGDMTETKETLRLLKSNWPEDTFEAMKDIGMAAERIRQHQETLAQSQRQLNPVNHQKGTTQVVKRGEDFFLMGSSFNPQTNDWDVTETPIDGDVINSQGLVANEVAGFRAGVVGAEESAKLEEQRRMRPLIEAAIVGAKKLAEDKANVAVTNRSNARALDTFKTGLNGLTAALGDTYTGPIWGLLPAMTENQQIADGALALMAPLMKAVFRESGEGTFTKDDQEILMEMLSSRGDKPAARRYKAQMVMTIVGQKLGQIDPYGRIIEQSPAGQQGEGRAGWRLMEDASGNKAYIGPNGEVEEVQ